MGTCGVTHIANIEFFWPFAWLLPSYICGTNYPHFVLQRRPVLVWPLLAVASHLYPAPIPFGNSGHGQLHFLRSKAVPMGYRPGSAPRRPPRRPAGYTFFRYFAISHQWHIIRHSEPFSIGGIGFTWVGAPIQVLSVGQRQADLLRLGSFLNLKRPYTLHGAMVHQAAGPLPRWGGFVIAQLAKSARRLDAIVTEALKPMRGLTGPRSQLAAAVKGHQIMDASRLPNPQVKLGQVQQTPEGAGAPARPLDMDPYWRTVSRTVTRGPPARSSWRHCQEQRPDITPRHYRIPTALNHAMWPPPQLSSWQSQGPQTQHTDAPAQMAHDANGKLNQRRRQLQQALQIRSGGQAVLLPS